MSSFDRLPNQEDDGITINNEKDCKKYLKKLNHKKRRLDKCDNEEKDKLSQEIRIIEIELNEYQNKNKVFAKKKNKETPKKEFSFDEEEIRKFNEKRKRENKEKKEAKAKAKAEEEKTNSKFWNDWSERYTSWDNEEQYKSRKKEEEYQKWYEQQEPKRRGEKKDIYDLKPFIKEYQMKIKDVPKDIISLNHNFNIKDYKNLSRNYHPDKLSGKSEYMYILNAIKDHYII